MNVTQQLIIALDKELQIFITKDFEHLKLVKYYLQNDSHKTLWANTQSL